ncbi:MAG TPA: hydrogenase formation protein HypD, partial [Clostridiales bacterium]|nr:hydrogenase formation protein HypD [Clostridiales bacterium]
MTIMEVCGTHTACIQKHGIPSLLPDNITLVSGPGCPVCVTAEEEIAQAIFMARQQGVIFTCFGDMMRVPCQQGSLYALYEQGKEVRLVTSPMDALKIAIDNPSKQVVYFGVGFETTTPHTAALAEAVAAQSIPNLCVFNTHKTMPAAIRQLLQKNHALDGLLCPGHVASVIGWEAFSFVSQDLHLPAVVAGFEAFDILAALLRLVDMVKKQSPHCVNMYPRAVSKEGNPQALCLLHQVMEPADAAWRGLGIIQNSGVRFQQEYQFLDAGHRFTLPVFSPSKPKGCMCANILRGEKTPKACVHFGKTCTPDHPVGPCMVSSEGSCAAFYRYKEA